MAGKAGVVHTVGWKPDGGSETKFGVRGLDETGVAPRKFDTKKSGDNTDKSIVAGVTGAVRFEAIDTASIAALKGDRIKLGTLKVYDLTSATPTVAVRSYHGRLVVSGGARAGHTDVVTLGAEVRVDTIPSHMSNCAFA